MDCGLLCEISDLSIHFMEVKAIQSLNIISDTALLLLIPYNGMLTVTNFV